MKEGRKVGGCYKHDLRVPGSIPNWQPNLPVSSRWCCLQNYKGQMNEGVMESNFTVSESRRSQRCRVPARPPHQVVEVKLGLHWGHQSHGTQTGESCIEAAQPKRSSSKAGEAEHLRPLTPDMERQHLGFALLSLCLVLVEQLFTMLLLVPLGVVMYILCHCMLEVCNLLFEFTELQLRD